MSLVLIGTGVSFDITLMAIEKLKKSDEIYIETYTNQISEEKIKTLERLINKDVSALERKNVESDFLIERARQKKIALLVSGDPLIATTHISLVLDAKKERIDTEIIHNSSIYTAAASKAGLQIYKFGKTCSIPNPTATYSPTSWFGIIKENLGINAHTLILLDTEPQPMDAKIALNLLNLVQNTEKDALLKNKKIIILSRIGEPDEKISYGSIEKLKYGDLGKPPFAIIIPAKLHMVEEEFLSLL